MHILHLMKKMLVEASDITVIIQGDIRPETGRTISSVRRILPNAKVILSTYCNEPYHAYSGLVDELVLSKDPGGMPPSVKVNHAAYNNTNRQLISTQAGLARVNSRYALKMRTDCVLFERGFIHLLEQYSDSDVEMSRLVVNSYYTRHPHGLACYQFHVSDWFVFGLACRVQSFFSAPLMTLDAATWFENNAHLGSSSYNARRFRARYTPEQHITVNFAGRLGYVTPSFLNETSDEIQDAYTRFLAKEFIVAPPSQLGFSLEKYPEIESSFYQRIDCVGHDDWFDLYSKTNCGPSKSFPFREVINRVALKACRLVLNRFRRPVIRAVMEFGGVKDKLFCKKAPRPKLACLITGVPRGSDFCLESLRFLTSTYETTFIAIYREEFDSQDIRNLLNRCLPGIQVLLIPHAVSNQAINHISSGKGPSLNLIKMWHEIYYVARMVDIFKFDNVMRTRFDIFFSPMHLPIMDTDRFSIFIPERMSWSGTNDMIAFGSPHAFKEYSNIYNEIAPLIEQRVIVPEMMVSCALQRLQLTQKTFPLYFGLYRDALMSTFDRRQLGVLAWLDPSSTTYQLGSRSDSIEARNKWVADTKSLVCMESLFPTFQTTTDSNFYPVDIDRRDGTPFRSMGVHGHFNRAILTIQRIEFIVCHYHPGWCLDDLTVSVDGQLFVLENKGYDEFGRVRVIGWLDRPHKGRSPWSKFGFSCIGAAVPAEIDVLNPDKRLLTISITEPIFK